jgi:alkylmercury lyase
MTQKATAITDRLATSETGLEAWLWLPLLRLLADGEPVSIVELAAATGRTADDVQGALAAVPDTEYDDAGRIIGQGLTLRPTRHHFEVDGQQLYTWCALDTLIFPQLLDRPVRIESAQRVGDTPVRISADATGVTSVEPATAVISLVNPDDLSQIRSAFCNQVHYFASPDEAGPWLERHPEATVIPVAAAFELATTLVKTMRMDPSSRRSETPNPEGPTCR